MKNHYNIILSLIICSLMSVGWGQIFYDNFDDGVWDDVWDLSDPSYTIEFDEGANGTNFSLKLIGSSNHAAGLSTSFEPAQPSYISIYIRPQLYRNYANSYLTIQGDSDHTGIFLFIDEDSCGYPAFTLYNSSDLYYCYGDLVVEEWYHIEFKNIDFYSQTFDWFVNGAIVHESADFRYNVSSFNKIHLYNFHTSFYENAWYDEIYIGDEPLDGAGCTDPEACNYDPDATEDDGSCEYEEDCAGECGGDAELDECGICDGDGSACDDSNIMNVITGFVSSFNDNGGYQEGIGGWFYVFNDPITEDLNMSLNGEILSKKRTYQYSGPMGGYTFETDNQFEYADSVNLNVSGDFNFDYTVFMPTNLMITSHNEGDAIEPLQDLIITYTASNYDFFYFSYYIDSYDDVDHYYSGFTYDTSFTIQSELLENASWININVDAINGKHPIDEIMDYNENTMANIFGSNGTWLSLGVDYREESQQGPHHSIIDLWKSGEFSRLYSQLITESEDNSDNQLMDITSDDIFIYSVMMESNYYGYDENIIYPFIIISSPIYFEDTQIFVNEVEIEANYTYPFGLTTVFGDNESEEYPTAQEINTYEIYINGEVISGEFSFSDSTEITNWEPGQSYDGTGDLYIEWADDEADFYSVKIYTWDWYGNEESCNNDSAFVTEATNFTISNTFFSGCLSNQSEINIDIASINGVVPIAGASGDLENSYGFSSWAWKDAFSFFIPIVSECTLGDFNNDTELDILDVTQMVNFIIEGQGSNYDECGDINEDGNLNILDVMTLVNTILNQP